MSMKHVCITVGLEIAFGCNICLSIDLFVAPNLKTVMSERSNFTQVLPEFRVPINSFHVLPKVLKPYFKSLEIAF